MNTVAAGSAFVAGLLSIAVMVGVRSTPAVASVFPIEAAHSSPKDASRSCVGRLAAICSAMAERAASIPGGRGTSIEAAKLARAGAIACCTDRAIDSLSDRSASWVAGPMIESVKSA